MDLGISNRVALVTGASRGIGTGIARRLAGEGARLVLVARRRELLDELSAELAAAVGTPPMVVTADLTDPTAPGRVLAQVGAAGLAPDILVNCAGGSRPLSLDAPEEAWDEALLLNFVMHRRLTHAVVPGMRERRWGRVVNITGGEGAKTPDGAAPAKAAMHSWARGLAGTLAADGVTINSVVPGRIKSEQIDERLHPDPAARERFIAENVPIGYFGEPEDISGTVAFLCSEPARYVTGAIVRVDGGMYRISV